MLPPFLFPPVSWFMEGMRCQDFTTGIGGSFEKQTLRSRYVIAGPNNLQTLSVPIVHGTGKLLSDIQISRDFKWAKEHIRSIETAYGNAPFFEFYDYRLLPLLQDESLSLSELIRKSIEVLHHEFRIDVPLRFVDDFAPEPAFPTEPPYSQVFDDRHGFRPGVSALDLLFNLGPEAGDYLRAAARP